MITNSILALIIVLICVILFIVRWLPLSLVGVMGCTLMVVCKICTFDEAFQGFSSSIVVLLMCSMIIGVAMFKTGFAQLLGNIIYKLSNKSERFLICSGTIICALLAMFIANTAIVAMMIPIIDAVCSTVSYMKRRNILLPITFGVMIGGSCTLVGCTPQLTANALLLKLSNMEMNMWSLTGPGICILIIYLIYFCLFGYKDGDKIWGNRLEPKTISTEEDRKKIIDANLDKRKIITMSIIIVLMIISYIINFFSTTLTALLAAFACIITGCCDTNDISKGINWNTVIFLGSCLGLGNALTVSKSGDLIGNFVTSIIGTNVSPFVIFVVLTFATLLISQFITNSTAIIIFLPIALSICKVCGYSAMPYCIGITLAASLACLTPLAAAQITMTSVYEYTFLDYLRYGIKPTILFYIGILLFVPLFYPLS